VASSKAGPGGRGQGSFRGISGHDHHTREFVRHLARRSVRVQLTDIPGWHPVKLPAAARDPWFETLDGPVDAAVLLQLCMPHQVMDDARRLVVNYTMFEASRVPASRIACAGGVDLVVVPTESSRRVWLAGGFPGGRLRVCPPGR